MEVGYSASFAAGLILLASLVPKDESHPNRSPLLAQIRHAQAGTIGSGDKESVTVDTVVASMDSRSQLMYDTAIRVIVAQLAREGVEGAFGVGLHESTRIQFEESMPAPTIKVPANEPSPLPEDAHETTLGADPSVRQQPSGNTPLNAPYAYEPLPTPTSIRIIEVIGHDPQKLGDGPIQCKLHIVDLADNPEYNAVSYVWGAPRIVYKPTEEMPNVKTASVPSQAIVCDGKELMITRNAHDFLKTAVTSQYALTHYAPDDMPAHARTFRLWIDAICINQKNTLERNAQVEMMAQIYSSAKFVLVWLGPGGWFMQSAEKAFRSIIELLKKHAQRSPISFTDIDIFNTAWWKSQQIPEPGDWIGLYVFLQHAWFHRSWIVQEVALTGRATLFCGPFQMEFKILSACITFLIQSGWLAQMERVGRYCVQGTTFSGHAARYLSQILAHNNVDARSYQPREWADAQLVVPGGKLQDLSTFLDPIMTIAGFGQIIKQRGKVDTDAHASVLRNVLEICRSFDATVPHDKIYAFLSIAEEALKEPRALPDRPIRIAYEKTADDVFTEVTGYLLASSRHIMDRQSEVLWQVEDKAARKISTLPSWVPDFSVECFPALIPDKVGHDWNCWPLEG